MDASAVQKEDPLLENAGQIPYNAFVKNGVLVPWNAWQRQSTLSLNGRLVSPKSLKYFSNQHKNARAYNFKRMIRTCGNYICLVANHLPCASNEDQTM